MSRYLEHPSRAARWRAGASEVLPDAAAADRTVWFAVAPGDADDHADAVWEGLLARSAGPDRAVVAAVPAFAYDVNLGDEVEVVATAEGPLAATRVVRDAGRFTFRVLFPPPGPGEEPWRDLQESLERYGCWFDVYAPNLVALSADPAVARDVARFLAAAERDGRLQYETGRTDGNPI